MHALLMHTKLLRIVGRVLKKLYGIHTVKSATRHEITRELGSEVEAWRQELPAFLDPEKVDSRMLIPLFQRQSNLLSLAHGHAEILIFRPCLFNDFHTFDGGATDEVRNNFKRCINAAMTMVDVVDKMVQAGQFYAGSWFAHYQAFCAVVILYTYTIRAKMEGPSEVLRYFRAAEKCQIWIASIATPETLAHRFSLTLEELRLEVRHQLQAQGQWLSVLGTEPPVGNSSLADFQSLSESDITSAVWCDGIDLSLTEADAIDWEQIFTIIQ